MAIPDDCVESITRGKSYLCFVIATRANMLMERHKNNRNLKRIDLKLYFTAESFIFEEASPYLEKFNKRMQQIIESGLIKEFNQNKKIGKSFYQKLEANETDYLSLYLSVISIAGCLFSATVFLWELLYCVYLKISLKDKNSCLSTIIDR